MIIFIVTASYLVSVAQWIHPQFLGESLARSVLDVLLIFFDVYVEDSQRHKLWQSVDHIHTFEYTNAKYLIIKLERIYLRMTYMASVSGY